MPQQNVWGSSSIAPPGQSNVWYSNSAAPSTSGQSNPWYSDSTAQRTDGQPNNWYSNSTDPMAPSSGTVSWYSNSADPDPNRAASAGTFTTAPRPTWLMWSPLYGTVAISPAPSSTGTSESAAPAPSTSAPAAPGSATPPNAAALAPTGAAPAASGSAGTANGAAAESATAAPTFANDVVVRGVPSAETKAQPEGVQREQMAAPESSSSSAAPLAVTSNPRGPGAPGATSSEDRTSGNTAAPPVNAEQPSLFGADLGLFVLKIAFVVFIGLALCVAATGVIIAIALAFTGMSGRPQH